MNFVPEVISRQVARNSLRLQSASPEILLGVGIAGMVASTILACRATLKMHDVLEHTKDNLFTAKELDNPNYSETDRSRDISVIYVRGGFETVKLYTPAVIVGVLSICAIRSSHGILTRRNVALTAAYGALEKGFGEYRSRVVEKYGEEEDRNLRYGTRTETIVNPKTKKKTKVTRVSMDDPSIYARFFDPQSLSWSKEPEYNLIFLKCQQNYANDMLHARGHVFLNEVYDMLGIDRSKAGAVVGWVLSKDNSTDNFINFGVFDGKRQVVRDFVNGTEGAILLDFNVDGVIYDKLNE